MKMHSNQVKVENGKVSNPKFLYAETGMATRSQVEGILMKGILCLGYDASYAVNIRRSYKGGMNEEGSSGEGYIWVENPEIGNALAGFDYDGSSRKREKTDDTWVNPNVKMEDALDDLRFSYLNNSFEKWKNGGSAFSSIRDGEKTWADLFDEEEEVIERYSPTTIIEDLGPIVKLSTYVLTEEQKQKWYDMNENDEYIRGEYVYDDFGMPIEGKIKIEIAEVKFDFTNKAIDGDSLICTLVPYKFPDHKLVEMVKTYSVSDVEIESIVSPKTGKKSIILHFKQKNIAHLVRLMVRKIDVKWSGQIKTLVFDYLKKKKSW